MDTNNEVTTQTVDTSTGSAPTPSEAPKVEKDSKPVEHRSFKANLKANLKEGSETLKEKLSPPSKNGEQPKEKKEVGTAFAQPEMPRQETELSSEPVPQRAAIVPPADMNEEEKAAFLRADPEIQAYHSRRYLDQRNLINQVMQAKQQIEAQGREFSEITKHFTPDVRDEYARLEIDVPSVIRRSILWDRSHRTRGGESLREYVDHYGYGPQDLYPELFNGGVPHQQQYRPQAQQEEQRYLTPEEAEALADKRIEEKFRMLQEEQIAHANAGHVQSFLNSKPLFKDPGTAHRLELSMAQEIPAIRARFPKETPLQWMERAYNRVLQDDPDFSGLMKQVAAKQEAQKQQVQASQAKEASRSISGGPGSGTPKQVSANFRDALARNLRG